MPGAWFRLMEAIQAVVKGESDLETALAEAQAEGAGGAGCRRQAP